MRPRSTLALALVALALVALVAAGCRGGGSPQTTGRPSTSKTTASSSATHQAAAFDAACAPARRFTWSRCPRPASACPPWCPAAAAPSASCSPTRARASACNWLPYARDVARDGVRSLVFDYDAAGREEEILASARWLRAHGVRRVVLVGASIGGRAVVTAAARGGPRKVDGVISLSGERILGAQYDLLPDARRLRCPHSG